MIIITGTLARRRFDRICSARRFLLRQYRAQMRRRAEQVQEELVSLLTFVVFLFWNP